MIISRLIPALLISAALSGVSHAEIITWTNAGGDGSWTNTANWDLSRLPGAFDDVVLDSTSIDDCTVPAGSYDIQSLTIAAGFTGTLSFSNITLNITNDFLINDGTFNPSRSNMTVGGDFIRTAGTLNTSLARFTFDGESDFMVDFGPETQTITSISMQLPEGVNGTVRGDIILNGFSLNSDLGSFITLEGDVTTGNNSFSFDIAGPTLIIADGATYDIRSVFSWSVFGFVEQQGTGRIRRDAIGLAFTDVNGEAIESFDDTTDIYITVIDEDENINFNVQDTTTVTVTNPSNGDTETITLTEVDTIDSIFRTTTPLTRMDAAANSGDGIIQMASTDDLVVTYTDPQDPDDSLLSNLIRQPFIWDGGGADNDFHTAENWNIDRAPSQFDDVIFNATSDKTCEMSKRDVFIRDLTIASDFTGEFIANQFAINQILNARNITQNGGTFTMNRRDFRLSGDFIRTGGTTLGSRFSRLTVASDNAIYDPGPDPMSIFFLFVGGDGTQVNGDTAVYGLFDVSTGNVTLNGSIIYEPNTSGFQMRTSSILNISDGALLDVRGSVGSINNNGEIILNGTGNYLDDAKSAIFTNSSGIRTAFVPTGTGFFVTVEDQDENLNGQLLDTTEVVVTSMDTGDSEIVTLTETGNKTGIFRNTTEFPTANGAANPDDGILQQNGVEDLIVTYIDNEFTDDQVSSSLQSGIITWDGDGADNLWTNPLNWSSDTVPGEFDAIVFDDTSPKDCDASGAFREVGNIEIKSDYNGTITFGNGFSTLANFIQNGGSVVMGQTTVIEIGGNLNLNVAAFNPNNAALSSDGSSDKIFDFGPETRTFRSFSTNGDTYDLVINGDAVISSFGTQINQFDGNVILNGTLTYANGANEFRNNARVPVTISNGAVLDIREVIDFSNQGQFIEQGTGRIRRNADGIAFTDNLRNPVDLFLGQSFFITVIDEDENLDITVRDTTTVLLENLDNGDTETIPLTENLVNSFNFINTAPVAISSLPADSSDGILQAQGGHTIRITYTDNEDPDDSISTQKVIQIPPSDLWMVE